MSLPALVEPGPELTPEQVTRYARHLLLPTVGREGQRRLLGARVAVARGSRFVRVVFVVIVLAFILKIGWDTWRQFTG